MGVEYKATVELPGARSESSYGIECMTPDVTKLDRLVEAVESQRLALDGLRRHLGIDDAVTAVAYVPGSLLTREPRREEVKQFNQDNTQSVAAFAVGVQKNLETVPIRESFEKLVFLPGLFEKYEVRADFSETPFHEACGDWAGKTRQFWARENFASRLLYMGALMNGMGYKVRFEDAFRPVGVQEGLFKRRVAWTKRDHPDWTDDQVINEAQSKTAVKPRLASHKAGAAIDAMIVNEATGRLLDFGHEYPDGGALVFPQTGFITERQWLNRQLFQVASGLSDTSLYVGEDWHISYGDNLASLDANGVVDPSYVAKYGPIKAYDHATGAITEVYNGDELDNTFDFS